jgi:hypothetical protein
VLDWQSLGYALTQVAHNFGAAAVVGGPTGALWIARRDIAPQRKLAWLALVAWGLQAASGATFGAISFHFYGQFPDIHGIAIAALFIKIACAVAGFPLAAAFLAYGMGWAPERQRLLWRTLLALGATALTAAAFLRWFS